MSGWHAEPTPYRSAKTMMTVTLLALLLVAAVPLALLAGVILMILGHVVGGLAVFGGSVLIAGLAVVLAGMSGMRSLRKLVSARSFNFVQQDGSPFRVEDADAGASDYADAIRLDRGDYTDVG